MSERVAVTLTVIATTVANAAVCAALMLIHARDEWIGATMLVLACFGSYLISRVVMHYGESGRRR